MSKEIKTIEPKVIHHIPAEEGVRDDTHVVKETITYTDGTTKKNLRVIPNYKRPFWITKEHYRNHKQKKESEELKKLNQYWSTQSDLAKETGMRLGMYGKKLTMRDTSRSPYLYGTDVDSRVYLKNHYIKKYGNIFTPYSICVLDTEVDINTNELLLITVGMEGKSFTVILKRLVEHIPDPISQLHHLFKKHIPKTKFTENMSVEFKILDNELDLIKFALLKVHEWQPDFLTMWNEAYDLNVMINICKKYDVDPKDLFSEPSLPKNLRYFRFIEDKANKVTASGVNKPPGPQERWHKVICPASFYIVDAMCAYNYIRVGGKAVPGGYSLDSVLKKELGDKLKKLKFEDENTSNLIGVDWHIYMVENKPLEYIIYNIWDVLSVIELDNVTGDLKSSLPVLGGLSHFDNFKSGPKKIVDNIQFFYYDRGRMLGCKDPLQEANSEIDLSNWIVMLPVHRSLDNGYRALTDTPDEHTNVKTHVFDSDRKYRAINVTNYTVIYMKLLKY